MTIHSTYRKGQKVFVILKDGSSFVDKFVQKKSGTIHFEERGRVPIKDIRAATIYKIRDTAQVASEDSKDPQQICIQHCTLALLLALKLYLEFVHQ